MVGQIIVLIIVALLLAMMAFVLVVGNDND